MPVVGWVVRNSGQIPVFRESRDAAEAFRGAVAAIEAGECVAVYAEGTITRDPDMWPMVGKTGAARVALATGCPVIPVAQWGPEQLLPPYKGTGSASRSRARRCRSPPGRRSTSTTFEAGRSRRTSSARRPSGSCATSPCCWPGSAVRRRRRSRSTCASPIREATPASTSADRRDPDRSRRESPP